MGRCMVRYGEITHLWGPDGSVLIVVPPIELLLSVTDHP